MARRPITNARTVLTGASSGIGRALAEELARQGSHLLLAARRADRLESLAQELRRPGQRILTVVGDVTNAATRDQIVEVAANELGAIDVLINNAGIGAVGPFSTASTDRLRRIMDVNFVAPVELIRVALPLLRKGERPAIVNVGSVLGHFAVPYKSEYCASKFALHGFTDALRCELLAEGIDVMLISPSTTRSEFFERLIEDQAGAASSAFRMSPETVARRTVRAIRRGQRELILSTSGRLAVALDRLAPSLASRLWARFG